MKKYRIGLIGAGSISNVYMQSMQRVPEGEVVAVWSRSLERARRFAAEHGLEHATDRVATLVEAVDVVCVNSPNARHAEHAIEAARAGCHVIVEKPLAASVDQAQSILDACASAGVGLAYAEELPFVPKFVRARDLLRSGVLGDVVYITQREAHAGPHSSWFFDRDEAGGGVLMDMACHSIECVRWLIEKRPVERVTAQISRTRHRDRTDLDDHAVVTLDFEGGITALCESSWALVGGMQSRLEIWGTEGYLAVDLLGETGIHVYTPTGRQDEFLTPGWNRPTPEWVYDNGYPQELSHFLRCFAQGHLPDESGEDGLRVLEILCAAYASAREGRAIALPFDASGVERAVDLWHADRRDRA
ncbi:MAG: Gfo/Idh/MocA family oxidoreductase [Myxococcota bacterium]